MKRCFFQDTNRRDAPDQQFKLNLLALWGNRRWTCRTCSLTIQRRLVRRRRRCFYRSGDAVVRASTRQLQSSLTPTIVPSTPAMPSSPFPTYIAFSVFLLLAHMSQYQYGVRPGGRGALLLEQGQTLAAGGGPQAGDRLLWSRGE